MILSGKHSVREALKSETTIDKICVVKGNFDRETNEIVALARAKNIKVMFCGKEVLDKETAGKHQGVAAYTSEFKYSETEDILKIAENRNEPPFMVILDGVTDVHNLGSVLRVAECAGVHGVIIGKHRAAGVNDTVVRISAGAAEHVAVARVTNINDFIRELKERNIWVYAAETGGDDIYKSNLNGAIAVVIGGEDTGVKELTRKLCDGVISLPIKGKVNSLNASVAAGAVLYEIVRQRQYKIV